MASINSLIPDTFSVSTTSYTLGVSTKVSTESTLSKSNYQQYFAVLGRVHTFNPSQDRNVEKIYEINTANGGERVEVVPGSVPTDQISISRYEIYRQPLLIAFGGLEANNLRGQNFPFTLIEYRFDPKDITKSVQIEYINCYFNTFSDAIDISGSIVDVTATIDVSFRRSRYILSSNNNFVTSDQNSLDAMNWISFRVNKGPNVTFQLDLNISGTSAKFSPQDLSRVANVAIDASNASTNIGGIASTGTNISGTGQQSGTATA